MISMVAAQAAKTMGMSEVWTDTYDEEYIHQFLPNPLTKFTSSSRSTEFKDIVTWNISQMITKNIFISTRIVITYVMKRGIVFCIYWKVNRNWDNNMIRISPWTESHCRTNISVRINKSKRVGPSESESGIQVGKLTIWVRLFEI